MLVAVLSTAGLVFMSLIHLRFPGPGPALCAPVQEAGAGDGPALAQ